MAGLLTRSASHEIDDGRGEWLRQPAGRDPARVLARRQHTGTSGAPVRSARPTPLAW